MSEIILRQLRQQHMVEIRRAFAELLAERLARSVGEISEEGLGAGDFGVDEHVELELADGSTMSLRHAFAVIDEQQRQVGVFSEHCGYFHFGMIDLSLIEHRSGGAAVRHDW